MAQTVAETKIGDMIRTNRLPGAFIFEGAPEDTDVLAGNLARSVVCLDTHYKQLNGGACLACLSCLKAARGSHPDIITTESEGDGARSFHIAKVREIIDDLYLSPNESEKKVYIIRQMQNMTSQGQNALLKSLEEPPASAVFIITVTSLDLILETVQSRAVKFKAEHAHNATDSYNNKNEYSETGEIIKNILAKSGGTLAAYQDMLKNIDKLGKPGILAFYSDLENAVRDVLAAKVFVNDLTAARFLYFKNIADFEILESCTKNYSAKKILDLSGKIRDFKSDLEYNANIRLNIASFFCAIT